MISNKLIAIDLGSSRILAMAAEVQANGAFKILAKESKVSDDIKHGIVEQGSGAAFKVNELVKLLQNSAKIPEIRHISVSIGAKSMKEMACSVTRFVGQNKVVTDELLNSMTDECYKKIVHPEMMVYDVIPLSYELDGARVDEPTGKTGTQITGRYNMIVGNSKIKEKIEGCFYRTGMKIRIEHDPLAIEALSAAILDDQDRNEGCALINFGATTTTMAIYFEGVLQKLLVVPLGGKNITKDIQELGISEQNAERLKQIKGSALESGVENPINIEIPSVVEPNANVRISSKFLATIIEARIEEILQPIFSALSDSDIPLNAGIIITGGGSKLANLPEFIVEKTGIYTRHGNHADWLTDDTSEQYFDPAYSQIIGTLILANEYRQQHPVVEQPNQKKADNQNTKKRSGIKDIIVDKVFGFFSDENTIDETGKKTEK